MVRSRRPTHDPLHVFEDAAEREGQVIAGNRAITISDLNGGPSPAVPVSILPIASPGTAGEVYTRFFVTPVGHSVVFPAGTVANGALIDGRAVIGPRYQTRNDLTTQVRLQIPDATGTSTDVMFDRDENPVSGQQPKTVTCVGAVNVETLLSEGALRQIGDTGGWGAIEVRSPGALASLSGNPALPTATRTNNTNQATVIKLDFNPDGRFLGDTFKGAFNNAVWLRYGIRESVRGAAGSAVSAVSPRLLIRSAPDYLGNPVDAGQDFFGNSIEVLR